MAKRKAKPTSAQKQTPKRRQSLKAKTQNQEEYIREIEDNDVTLCTGPAGTGKTAVSVGIACDYLLDGRVDKIIVTRPVIESGRGLGFLPGTFEEKIHPYLIPVLEEMEYRLNSSRVQAYRDEGKIEVCPLEYMRGRNFHNCFMILDEAQNATFEQLKMFITRIGWDSKAVINGDMDQTDLTHVEQGGLDKLLYRLDEVDGVGIAELTEDDIIRNKIISRILKALHDN
jgi:phosphate starvation-inducible PhoH-like protein|tara:strand:+ start:175 stop:858 length:684 start_codon:yes stop_codon:yes gene_type:complete